MSEPDAKFIIEQDVFRGPIDLLYYLILQKELDISEISLSVIMEQYLKFVEILQDLDLDNIGEFLDIAATLLQAKARALFPEEQEELEGEDFDPTDELINELLEYKKFKLAGKMLVEKRTSRENMHTRGYEEHLEFDRDEEGNPLEEVDLGGLLNMFTELMAQTLRNLPDKIVYDDISIDDHIESIMKRLESAGEQYVSFSEFITGTGNKTPSREFMCGAFIACLELARQYHIKITQTRLGGEIRIEAVSQEERGAILEERRKEGTDEDAAAEKAEEEAEASADTPDQPVAEEQTPDENPEEDTK